MAFVATIESTAGTQNQIMTVPSATIEEVLAAANINSNGLHIMVDNRVVDKTHRLNSTCTIQLRKNATGNKRVDS